MSSNENTTPDAELLNFDVWTTKPLRQIADEQLADQLSTLHKRLIKVCHWALADHPEPGSTLYYQVSAMLRDLESMGGLVSAICSRLKVANSQPKNLNPEKEA